MTPVFVYLHRNVHESMEMNQTVQAVSVVPKDVLLLVRIAINLLVFVVQHHRAVKLMALHIILLIANAAQQNAPQPMD